MATTWIIDGYNFIRTSRRFAELEAIAAEPGKQAALEWLGEFTQLTGFELCVVFDAYSSLERDLKDRSAYGLRILESRGSYTADEEIIAMAEKLGQGAIVISSDRAILESAIRADCSVLSSEEFEREVAKVLAAQEEEEEDRRQSNKGRAFKPPKEKRKAYQLLRKYQ